MYLSAVSVVIVVGLDLTWCISNTNKVLVGDPWDFLTPVLDGTIEIIIGSNMWAL
jgi:hypothetical protein